MRWLETHDNTTDGSNNDDCDAGDDVDADCLVQFKTQKTTNITYDDWRVIAGSTYSVYFPGQIVSVSFIYCMHGINFARWTKDVSVLVSPM